MIVSTAITSSPKAFMSFVKARYSYLFFIFIICPSRFSTGFYLYPTFFHMYLFVEFQGTPVFMGHHDNRRIRKFLLKERINRREDFIVYGSVEFIDQQNTGLCN